MRVKGNRQKKVKLFLDGKVHIEDVLDWALAANMTLDDAKKHLLKYYRNVDPEIRIV